MSGKQIMKLESSCCYWFVLVLPKRFQRTGNILKSTVISVDNLYNWNNKNLSNGTTKVRDATPIKQFLH